MTGLPSVLIPPHPLRAIGDFKEWFGGILQSLPLPGSDQYNYSATALMLWDHYRRAKAWLSQHEFEVPSIDPAEYGRARAWMSSRQGDSPATRQAHQALAELVNGLQTPPAAPSSEAKPVDVSLADAQSQNELADEDKAIALAVKDQTLSVAHIAEKLGVDRKTPYRWLKFMSLWKGLQAQQSGSPPPRGSKDREGNLEAQDDFN